MVAPFHIPEDASHLGCDMVLLGAVPYISKDCIAMHFQGTSSSRRIFLGLREPCDDLPLWEPQKWHFLSMFFFLPLLSFIIIIIIIIIIMCTCALSACLVLAFLSYLLPAWPAGHAGSK